MTDLAIFYEHPVWFEHLFAALDRRGIGYSRTKLDDYVFDPAADASPAPVVFNRLAMSAAQRHDEHPVFFTQALMAHFEQLGARVVNGSAALAVDASKARQLSLFRSLGLGTPATRIVHRRADLAKAAQGLRFPLMVKANIGGSGAGMARYDSLEDLTLWADDGTTPTGVDGVALVQEYVPARDGRVIRCETLNGRFLYALALDGAGSTFDLCPADVCAADRANAGGPQITISRFDSAARDRPRRGGRLQGGQPGRGRDRIHDRRSRRRASLLRHQRPLQLRRQAAGGAGLRPARQPRRLPGDG